jgi:heme-degrading monooxygenase HmoA
MIVRLYKAHIKPGKEQEWERVIQSVALPLMRKQSGLVDAFYTWDTWGATREFAFVSVWKSLEDVKRFAGAHWDQPVVPEEERPLIQSCRVEHFEPVRSPR